MKMANGYLAIKTEPNIKKGFQLQRYISLDVFRGLTIILMIIVNSMGTSGKVFAILDHAEWFGFTLADLVFPSFLFAMGNSMAFSGALNLPNQEYILKALKRSFLIFAIGLLLAWFPFFLFNKMGEFEWKYFENLRFMGVLQRIALCYLFSALIIKYFKTKGILLISLILLIGYYFLLLYGAPNGYAFDKMLNFGSKIDNLIIPQSHIFRRDDGFEPEGILGTMPAIVNVLAGFIAGIFIKNSNNKEKLIRQFIIFGVLSIALALFLANWFPIGKKLWTSTYVMLCNGIDLLILAILIFLIDLKNKLPTKFFEIFGKNPLIIYIFSIALIKIMMIIQVTKGKNLYGFLSADFISSYIQNEFGSLIFAILILSICALFAQFLDKRKIIIKI